MQKSQVVLQSIAVSIIFVFFGENNKSSSKICLSLKGHKMKTADPLLVQCKVYSITKAWRGKLGVSICIAFSITRVKIKKKLLSLVWGFWLFLPLCTIYSSSSHKKSNLLTKFLFISITTRKIWFFYLPTFFLGVWCYSIYELVSQPTKAENDDNCLFPAVFQLVGRRLRIPDLLGNKSDVDDIIRLELLSKSKHVERDVLYPFYTQISTSLLVDFFSLCYSCALLNLNFFKLCLFSLFWLCVVACEFLQTMSYKNAVLNQSVPLNNSETELDTNQYPKKSVDPHSALDPVDKLSQVQKDSEEFAQSSLFAKILGSPVELKTIISKTKLDWKMVQGDVDYLEMGNGWLMIRFANPQDKFLVWSERPWHVLGQLLVLREWEPLFDPFVEELCFVDLWVRVLRIPVEMINYDCVAHILESNKIGMMVRLDQRSMLRNKIRFARAVVNVNINETLKSCAEVVCADGRKRSFFIWYEDFSEGCAHCGETDHSIDDCPLLILPTKEIKISVQRPPKSVKNNEYYSKDSMGEKPDETMAQTAYIVHPKPKQKPMSIGEFSKKNDKAVKNDSSGKLKKNLSELNGKKNEEHDTTLEGKIQPLKADREGSHTLKIASPIFQPKPSNDEGDNMRKEALNTPKSPPFCQEDVPYSGEYAPSKSDVPVFINAEKKTVHDLAEKILEKQPMMSSNQKNQVDFENMLDEKGTFLSNSPSKSDDLLSASSEQSIIRQIKGMEVEQPLEVDNSETSTSTKRRGEMEDVEPTVSSSLKRKKK